MKCPTQGPRHAQTQIAPLNLNKRLWCFQTLAWTSMVEATNCSYTVHTRLRYTGRSQLSKIATIRPMRFRFPSNTSSRLSLPVLDSSTISLQRERNHAKIITWGAFSRWHTSSAYSKICNPTNIPTLNRGRTILMATTSQVMSNEPWKLSWPSHVFSLRGVFPQWDNSWSAINQIG